MSPLAMIHSTAALFIIACISVPFFAMKMATMSPSAVAERARKLVVFLRIPNFVLIVSLITGLMQSGLFFGGFYFSTWLLMVFIVFLGIAALLGITSKTLKVIRAEAQAGQDFSGSVKKLQRLSIIMSVLIVVMVVIKLG